MKDLWSIITSNLKIKTTVCIPIMADPLAHSINIFKRISKLETKHMQLKEDLIEHLWNHHPDLYSYNI